MILRRFLLPHLLLFAFFAFVECGASSPPPTPCSASFLSSLSSRPLDIIMSADTLLASASCSPNVSSAVLRMLCRWFGRSGDGSSSRNNNVAFDSIVLALERSGFAPSFSNLNPETSPRHLPFSDCFQTPSAGSLQSALVLLHSRHAPLRDGDQSLRHWQPLLQRAFAAADAAAMRWAPAPAMPSALHVPNAGGYKSPASPSVGPFSSLLLTLRAQGLGVCCRRHDAAAVGPAPALRPRCDSRRAARKAVRRSHTFVCSGTVPRALWPAAPRGTLPAFPPDSPARSRIHSLAARCNEPSASSAAALRRCQRCRRAACRVRVRRNVASAG